MGEPSSNDSSTESEMQTKMRKWLNQPMKIELSDGRTVIGAFLCTDNHPNIILGGTREYWLDENGKQPEGEEPRTIGLVMVPAQHITSIAIIPADKQDTEIKDGVNDEVTETVADDGNL